MITCARKIYHWSREKTDRFLYLLCRGNHWGFAVHLARLARVFFLREFFPKHKNYRNVDELKQLVTKALAEQTAQLMVVYPNSTIPPEITVLMIFPKYVNNSDDYIETNFEDTWVVTAKNIGINVEIFYADKISYISPNASNLEVMNQERKNLLSKVKSLRPRLIFLDINYLGNQNTINASVIKEIRTIHSCKIAGHMGDYYSNEAFRIAEYWSKSLDIVLHSSPGMPTRDIGNFYYTNYFVNEKSFYPVTNKSIDISFSGSGNISRYVYLAFVRLLAKRRGYNSEIYVHDNSVGSALSSEKYAYTVRESRVLLNLSARSAPGVRVVTGRVKQAMATKSLLLEEENNALASMLTPFGHYIPFNSEEELAVAIDFSTRFGELVDKITDAAYSKYCLEHSSKVVWSGILNLCDVCYVED